MLHIKIVDDRLYHHKDAPPDMFMTVAAGYDTKGNEAMWRLDSFVKWTPDPPEDWTLVKTQARRPGTYELVS